MSAHLFAPYTLRGLTLRNRIVMSPMCMYSAESDGCATEWHLVHLGARAVGGCGLIITEATAVEPRGRISENDLGLWDDAQIAPLARIVDFCHAHGAAVGIQLAHAGRKAFSRARGFGPQPIVAPSAIPFAEGWATPHALTVDEIEALIAAWQAAARRALQAGFDVVEIHSAHGYLLNEFLSPISNHRTDEYGGDLWGRARLLFRIVEAVRAVWPEEKPLFVRISATDWVEGGLQVEDFVQLAPELQRRGVDVIDCSSGGITPTPPPPDVVGAGYQTPFAARIRQATGVPTMAVGLITAPEQADHIVRTGQADLVALGRELLRDPHWPLRAAHTLGYDVDWPRQYERARPLR
ncbi:NADPH dehydrogenase NamA [Ardenticatena maritima]|uniref:Oxidoreductase n=3 Tax=Ardenticatena maritima TaxID=872965 RepID=A0A0P6YDZ9_9CHLR|nr:NADPH dehydrogenase NamA [Ardenticatena maritima]KPL87741.1 oxidoreductase [Ardenticatena maritima]